MMSRLTRNGTLALESAAMPFAGTTTFTAIMTITTRMRGGFG